MAYGTRRILVTVPKALLRDISTPEALERLERLGEVVYNERERENLTEDELRELVRGVDACVTSWGSPRFTARVLENADRLKIIGHAAGSVKPYVTEEVFRRGIVVVNAADVIAVSVAEFALAMILNCLRRAPDFVAAMRRKDWSIKSRRTFETRDLRGKTVGLVGFGLVARQLVELLKPFKVRSPRLRPLRPPRGGRETRVRPREPGDLAEGVGRGLDPRRPDGGDVPHDRGARAEDDEEDRRAREHGQGRDRRHRSSRKSAQGEVGSPPPRSDVFEQEPLPPDHPLYELDNAYLTPHVAGPSDERRRELLGAVVEEFERFFSGRELTRAVKLEELKVRA